MKIKILKMAFAVFFLIAAIFAGWSLRSQETQPEGNKSLLMEPKCKETCGYAVHLFLWNRVYEISADNQSKICMKIEKMGKMGISEDFLHKKCQELCGFPAFDGEMAAPNIRNCYSCISEKKNCKVFDDGVSRCWDMPGAKQEKVIHCQKKAGECYSECLNKSKIHLGSRPE